MKVKIVIILVILSLVVIVLTVYFDQKSDPKKIIKSKIDLTLPTSSKVVNFYYDKSDGYFDAKILIDANNIESIKKDLNKFFKQEYTITNKDYIPRFENTTSWWDMDINNIIVCYSAVITGEQHLLKPSPKSIPIWAFITKQNDGRYYLYISWY